MASKKNVWLAFGRKRQTFGKKVNLLDPVFKFFCMYVYITGLRHNKTLNAMSGSCEIQSNVNLNPVFIAD